MQNDLRKNFLLVIVYAANIWHSFIPTKILLHENFQTQKFCKQNYCELRYSIVLYMHTVIIIICSHGHADLTILCLEIVQFGESQLV